MHAIRLIPFFLLLGVLATSTYAERPVTEQLEEKYFQTLDKWVEHGGPVDEVQDTVVKTCGRLVMLTASNAEKASLSITERDEFHHRVDVCTKMTVNRVYPQPEFKKKEIIKIICDESNINLFTKLCKRYGFR